MESTAAAESATVRDKKEPLRNAAPRQITRTTLSNKLRRSVAKTARAEGNSNSLWAAAGSLSSIHGQFAGSDKPATELEIDLHDLWFTYYHAAKNTLADNPTLDRLVVQILQAREIGPLQRPADAGGSTTTATTSDGVIWTDLPFLVPDMTWFWLEDWAAMRADNRLAFSTFLAKLASVGVCRDRLSSIGLTLFRDTLETVRPLGAASGDDDGQRSSTGKASRRPQDVTVAELLPAVHAWMSNAGYKMIQLSDARWNGDASNDDDAGGVGVGELFRADPSAVDVSGGGFSPDRWIFWLQRLKQIAEEADQAGDANLGELARGYRDNMLALVGETDSAVKRKLNDTPPPT